MSYYIGIDLGGTNIAIGIVNEEYRIIAKKSIPTKCPRSADKIVDDIAETVKDILFENRLTKKDISWIGIGTPGSVNSEEGYVERAHNLGFIDTPLKNLVEDRLSIDCHIENDANAAAFGEYICGNAKGAENALCITIGTGIGGGIIINGKIYSGSNFYGAELGHVVMIMNGLECNCGRKGCIEKYCSATALISQTKEAILNNSETIMWQECQMNIDNVTGKTAFDSLKKGDTVAKKVIDNYIDYLACACTNYVNIFQPDVLLIGGGISKEGDTLLNPLRRIVTAESFDKNSKKPTKILTALLGNDAGIIGAAFLGRLH